MLKAMEMKAMVTELQLLSRKKPEVPWSGQGFGAPENVRLNWQA